MFNRLIMLALAAGAIASAQGQINSSGANGYFSRGIAMYSDGNPTGAVDQLNRFFRLNGDKTSEEAMEAGLVLAKATLKLGRVDDARKIGAAWLAEFPYSPLRASMQALMGECEFVTGNYAGALDIFNSVNPALLSGDDLADYHYRRAYSLMKLGEYEQASQAFAEIPSYAAASTVNAGKFYRAYIAFTEGDYPQALRIFETVNPDIEPGNTRDFYLGQIYYLQGDYDNALRMASSAANYDLPADMAAENTRIIGESYYLTGDPSKAVEMLRKYVAFTSSPARSALYILGLSQYEEGDYADAVKSLRPVTSADDAMAQSACLYIGQAQLKDSDTDAAIMSFHRALQMDHDPDVQEAAYYNYAVARIDGAQIPFGSSVSTFENFLRRYPRSKYAPAVQEYIVTGYITDNNYDKALESISRIKKPSDAILKAKQRVLYSIGARELSAGRPEKALQSLEEARRLGKYDSELAAETDLLIADCKYRTGNYREAASGYRKYLSTAPSSAPNLTLARYDLGYALFAQKEFDKAIAEFERVAAVQGGSPAIISDSYNRIGDARYYKSDFASALDAYGKAYNANPSAADYAMFQMAIMEGYRKDYNKKDATLSRMIEQFPTSALIPSALLEKGENYLQLSRPSDAAATYRRLVKNYPSTEQGRNGYLQLAMTLQNQGDAAGANEAYRDIISRYPTSDEAKLATAALKRVYSESGDIEQFADFLSGIQGAPSIDPSELEELAYESAEKAFADNKDTSRLRSYIGQYPSGSNMPRALGILASEAYDAGNDDEAVEFADRIITSYPDNAAIEQALAIKGDIELKRGRGEVALSSYNELIEKASTPQALAAARLGVLRVGRDLGHWEDVVSQADAILATTATGDAEKTEAVFSKGLAYKNMGQNDKAIEAWKKIADRPADLYGARSAVELGQLYLDTDRMKSARTVAEKLVNSKTPHQYWLARGFILLSDINRAQGKDFEAEQYLTALKENYPGHETDIFTMIEERLNK